MDKHFLNKDLKQAYKEKACAFQLSMQSQKLLIDNDFYAVEEKLVDMLKSVHELKKLQENKKTQDRFEGLVGHMQAEGVNAVLVRRLINENR